MVSKKKNLSDVKKIKDKKFGNFRIGVIVSEWNEEITNALYKGAFETLIDSGIKNDNIITKYVPGSFELPLGAQMIIENCDVDSVICLGCVIQGETRHFDFICDAVANGITQVGLEFSKPVIFGVLTTNNIKQAVERSGGKHGNKGVEAAVTAIKMMALQADLSIEFSLL
jgi:6,7-dimethyl-8-ribityllumazine synthase